MGIGLIRAAYNILKHRHLRRRFLRKYGPDITLELILLKLALEIAEEMEEHAGAVDAALNGLEALKLGAITIRFSVDGSGTSYSGSKGRTGEDSERSIGRIESMGSYGHTSCRIQAFSYRGYRFSDPEQGGGISGVLSSAAN